MDASTHDLATATGLAALRDGGNALDAVIAANAMLTVVYPDQTSTGRGDAGASAQTAQGHIGSDRGGL
jgi:gamma-glutamyltranspeptidase/glutathione hydrolase